jgi:signal transduction histidine kinase
MKAKSILLFCVVISLLTLFAIPLSLRQTPDVQLNIREVNNIVKILSDNWEIFYGGNGILPYGYEIDYAVITNEGRLIAATRHGLNEHINDAVRNRDTIVDIITDGVTVGKVIFYNDIENLMRQNRTNLIFASAVIIIILLLIFTGYTFYLHITLLRPFRKMQGFAHQIAAGNLDVPLEMDKDNLFGAFTESFDLMREELHRARENERNADKSKKELVASLSHDIKTPVASIKAVAEYRLLVESDSEEVEQLEIINTKAEQINSLITNMFHSTLEELQALSVNALEIPSTSISKLIYNADYEKRVAPFTIPNCIILADIIRLQQVFDNIISNSYKYAGTGSEIAATFAEQHLVIEIIDFGAGISEEELPFIFNKFYRGKNTDDINGYGLGLYISKYFIEKMSGNIQCENRTNGFTVRLMLRLAG